VRAVGGYTSFIASLSQKWGLKKYPLWKEIHVILHNNEKKNEKKKKLNTQKVMSPKNDDAEVGRKVGVTNSFVDDGCRRVLRHCAYILSMIFMHVY